MTDSEDGDVADAQAKVRAALRVIGARALQSNLLRVTELNEALRAATGDGLPDSARQTAVAVAHQLVGSAGTFGYGRVSVVARQVELFFTEQAFADEQLVQAATRSLTLMRRDLLAGPDERPDLD